VLLIAEAAAGAIAGITAVVLMVSLPGWLLMHEQSLTGPPLLAMVMLTIGAMVHAPRFSLWYGMLAAVAGLFVATEGIGLPLAAVAWATIQRARETHRALRVTVAMAPTLVVLLFTRWWGNAWPHAITWSWHGGVDRGLRAAGQILGAQLAPAVINPALRFLVIADLSLVIVAVIATGWWRVGRPSDGGSVLHRLYAVGGLVVGALAIGLAGRTLAIAGMPDLDLAGMMPLVVPTLLVLVVSIAGLWNQWPRWGKLLAVVLIAGWWQAAVRS
jgi:hypothetical protein